METSASPKTKNNSMDWNLGLGTGGNEHDTGKFLDDSDDFTPLPFDNFNHGGSSNDKAAEQILYEQHPEPLLPSNVDNLKSRWAFKRQSAPTNRGNFIQAPY